MQAAQLQRTGSCYVVWGNRCFGFKPVSTPYPVEADELKCRCSYATELPACIELTFRTAPCALWPAAHARRWEAKNCYAVPFNEVSLGRVVMYTLFRLLPVKRLAYEQVPPLIFAWIIAELFFKFHSFTLECAAFLATWFMLDALVQKVVRPLVTRGQERAP